MKRTLALILILTMVFTLAACGKKGGEETTAPNTDVTNGTDATDATEATEASYNGSLTDLINALYQQVPVEFPVCDPTAVDLNDEFSLSNFTGLTDASLITEAVYSEPMMGSQAYSLCAMRLAPGVDGEEVADLVLGGVDPAKWICVSADNLRVGLYQDILVLIMVSSSMSETLADDMMKAFSTVVGSELDLILTK